MMLFPSRNRETFGVKPNIDGFDVIFEPKFPSRNQEASLSKQTMYDLFQGYHEFPSRNREDFQVKFIEMMMTDNFAYEFPSRNRGLFVSSKWVRARSIFILTRFDLGIERIFGSSDDTA